MTSVRLTNSKLAEITVSNTPYHKGKIVLQLSSSVNNETIADICKALSNVLNETVTQNLSKIICKDIKNVPIIIEYFLHKGFISINDRPNLANLLQENEKILKYMPFIRDTMEDAQKETLFSTIDVYVDHIIAESKDYKTAVTLLCYSFYSKCKNKDSEVLNFISENKMDTEVSDSVMALSKFCNGEATFETTYLRLHEYLPNLATQRDTINDYCISKMQDKFSNLHDDEQFLMLIRLMLYVDIKMEISIKESEILLAEIFSINQLNTDTDPMKAQLINFLMGHTRLAFNLMGICNNSSGKQRVQALQKKFDSIILSNYLAQMDRVVIEKTNDTMPTSAEEKEIFSSIFLRNIASTPVFKGGSIKKLFIANTSDGALIASDSVGEIYDTNLLKPKQSIKIHNDERIFFHNKSKITAASIGPIFIGNRFVKSIINEFFDYLNRSKSKVDMESIQRSYIEFLKNIFKENCGQLFAGHHVFFIKYENSDILVRDVYADKIRNKHELVEEREIVLKKDCHLAVSSSTLSVLKKKKSKNDFEEIILCDLINHFKSLDTPISLIFLSSDWSEIDIRRGCPYEHSFGYLSDFISAIQSGYIDISKHNSNLNLSTLHHLLPKDFYNDPSKYRDRFVSFNDYTKWCLNKAPIYNTSHIDLFNYFNRLAKSDPLFGHKLEVVKSAGVKILFEDGNNKHVIKMSSYFDEKPNCIWFNVFFMDSANYSYYEQASSLRSSIEIAYKHTIHKLRYKHTQNQTQDSSHYQVPFFPLDKVEMKKWENIVAKVLENTKKILSIVEKSEKQKSLSNTESDLLTKYKSSVIAYGRMRIIQIPPENELKDNKLYEKFSNNKQLRYSRNYQNLNVTFTANICKTYGNLLLSGHITKESEWLKAALYDIHYVFDTPLINLTDYSTRYAKLLGCFPTEFIALICPELLVYDRHDAEAALGKRIDGYDFYLSGPENIKSTIESKASGISSSSFFNNSGNNTTAGHTTGKTSGTTVPPISDSGDSKREVKDTGLTTVNKGQTNPTISQQVFTVQAKNEQVKIIISKLKDVAKDDKDDKFLEFFKLFNNEEINFNKALRTACTSNDSKVFKLIKILLESHKILNIDINQAAGEKRRSAIHHAAISKNDDVYALLIKYGANHQALDAYNKSAEDYFQQKSLPQYSSTQHARRGV